MIIILVLGLVNFGLVAWLFKSWIESKRTQSELLVFPDAVLPCASVYKELISGKPVPCNKFQHCTHAHLNTPSSLIRILEEVAKAEREILLCMHTFTFDRLANLIIARKKSGCRVSIIIDSSNEDRENDQIPRLKSKGIEVRRRPEDPNEKYQPRMHNKFVVIDSQVVLHGSLNWGLGAILHHDETVIINRQKNLVNNFRSLFERLWCSLDDGAA